MFPPCPGGYSGSDLFCEVRGKPRGLIREIRFDLFVAESETTSASGGIGINVVKAGSGANRDTATYSRVQFLAARRAPSRAAYSAGLIPLCSVSMYGSGISPVFTYRNICSAYSSG